MKCLAVDAAAAQPSAAMHSGTPSLGNGSVGAGAYGAGIFGRVRRIANEAALPEDDACWSPLRCDPISRRIEYVDSPLDPREPSIGNKKDVSFSTQMVRRAVSFIFEERENSPVSSRGRNTAVAA